MSAASLLAWLILMFPLVYSPGPSNTLFASNGAHFGVRRTLPFLAGINISFAVQSLLAGFGLSMLLVRYPLLFTILRYAGIAYIVYLGVVFLRSAVLKIVSQPRCLTLKDGLVLTMLNPKAWVIQVMMFSQFLEKGDAMAVSVFKLTSMLIALNLSGHLLWIIMGAYVLARATNRFTPRMQNTLYAGLLFGSVIFLL